MELSESAGIFPVNNSLTINQNSYLIDAQGQLLPFNQIAGIKNIAFIDPTVKNYENLVAGIVANTEIVLLDPTRDGVEQITQVLASRTEVSSAHIITHGEEASLQFGTGKLNLENLDRYRASLEKWKNALTPDADVLVYGCNVAAGEKGTAFVQYLSQLTDADIAASDDLTGSAALGGDWQFEVKTGEIEAKLALKAETIAGYDSVLLSFAPVSNFPVTSSLRNLTVGDFNKDSNPDLVMASTGFDYVSTILGTGTGSFGTATKYNSPTGTFTWAVAVGDLNKDGNLDLATANNGSSNVSVLLGNGTGNFGTATNFSVGSGPYSVALADFNQDGNLDLTTANQSSGNVSVLLGDGTGNFGTATNFSAGSSPSCVVVDDFNKDGKLDLATANQSSNNISILLGDGTGKFGNATNFSTGGRTTAIVASDFNKDGNLDLATANGSSNNVSVLLGNGTGNFGSATNYSVGNDTLFIAAGDLDGDGNIDLATADNQSNRVSVLLGTSTGNFNSAINFAVGTNPQGIVIADLNKDGSLDIATANFGSQNVSILLNNTPLVNFGAASYNATEGSSDTVVNIPVTLSATPATDVTVPIVINNGSTATEGVSNDYTLSTTSVTFKAGATGAELTQNVAVTIEPDNIAENDETVILDFDTITGAVAGTTKQTTLTIKANDGVDYSISASDATIVEGNSDSSAITFTVTRSGGIDAASSVNYLIGGGATNNSDYKNIGGTSGATGTNGTINFAAGETQKTITMDVLGDTFVEPNEAIAVTLSNPTAPGPVPTITSAIATTIINNDDSANSAPILDNSKNPTLEPISQNVIAGNNTGTLVSAIIGNNITDFDIGAVKGIAVTQIDNSNGTWQFSTNNGSSWTNFSSVSDSSATVLTATANDKIRFLPATNFSGSSTISFRAWDTTNGSSNGATGVNSSINGGTTAFSSASETASIAVTPLSAPEIEVRNAGINITDETVIPIDFGITTPGKSISKTFTIRNTGSAALNVSELKLPSGFSLVGSFPQTVQAGESSNFDVKLDASGIANPSGTLSFTTNDSDENPFNFAIGGAVTDHVCDLQQVWQGLENILDKFQQIVEGKMQGIKFPILGPLKKIDPNFINSFKDSLINQINNVPNLTEDLLIKGIKNGLSPYFPNLDIINYGNADQDQVAYQIKFGQAYSLPNVSLSENLGVPALGLTLNGQGVSTFRYDFSLAFGVHKEFCFFIDTDRTNLSASIDFGLDNNFQAKGNMGFLQLDLKNDANNPTKIGAEFGIKLKDLDNLGGPDDGNRLTLEELKGSYRFDDLYDFTLDSNANLGLNAITSINGNAAIPSFGFDLALNWPLFKYESGEFSWPVKPTVSFNNTKLYLGTFISNFAKPVLGKVNNIIDPFRPVINLLNSDTKLLSKLGLGNIFDRNGDSKITLLEVAATLSGSNIDPGFFDAVNSIDKLSQLLNKISTTNGQIAIDLGSYSLGNFDVSNSSSSIQKATINTKSVAQDFKSQIQFQKPVDSTTKEFLVGFTDMGGVDFPILKKPQTIIQLLMGTPDVTLFTYKVPKLSVDFNIRKTFPIWGPISGLLEGNFKAQTHIAFGFDSYGLQQWKNANFSGSSADKVLDGFYISDRENPDGTGPDVDELSLAARIAAGAGINVGVASGYLKGGIQGNVGIDLIDIGEFSPKVGGDGKIRASEITSRISQPTNLFDINGTVNAFLGAEVKVGFKILGKKIQKTVYNNDFATFELAKFNIGPSSTSRGKVSNKYMAEATVFFDANFNGVQDSNEPLTISNTDGSFDLDISLDDFDSNKNGKIDVAEGRIVAKDGIDIYTYLPQETPLMATPDSSMVTPLTTLIGKLVEQGINPDEAQTKLKAALGLPLTIDLNNYDPLEAINQNDPNGFKVLADHVQVQDTIGQITNLISGASTASKEKISESTIAAIVEQINTGATLNLSDSAQLQNLIESAATKVTVQDPSLNLQQLFRLAPEAAKVIAEQNQRIEKVTSSNSKETFIDQIVAIQNIALGETTKDLKDTASGIKPINDLLAENTGIVLDAQIEESTVESANSLPDFKLNKMFDSGFYLAKNLDVAEAVAKKVFPNAWTHFNQFGYAEGRNPSSIFATDYLKENSDVAEAVAKGTFHSGFEHFVKHGLTEGRAPAPEFNSLETFYLSENSDVAEAVHRGNLGSGVEHLVRFGMAEGRDPFTQFNVLSSTFDSTFYLAENQDVAEAVNQGVFHNAFEHFVRFGLSENRSPNTIFSNFSYSEENQDVAAAVAEGKFKNALDHYLKFGFLENRKVNDLSIPLFV